MCVVNPQAFRNDTGRFNGAEQTISLANRVTSLSDKFAVQQPKAIKRSKHFLPTDGFLRRIYVVLFCPRLLTSASSLP